MRSLCPEVDPSHGHMHLCLRKHFDELSEACRQSEFYEIRIEMKSSFLVNPVIKVTRVQKAQYVSCMIRSRRMAHKRFDCTLSGHVDVCCVV